VEEEDDEDDEDEMAAPSRCVKTRMGFDFD